MTLTLRTLIDGRSTHCLRNGVAITSLSGKALAWIIHGTGRTMSGVRN